MTPFQVLGVPVNCSVDEAKKAWRSLAQQLHPDKGGNEAKFKEAKAAWEQIEAGYRWTEPPKSTFTPPPTPRPSPFKPASGFAGKPAPGYEAKRTRPVLPRTKTEKIHGSSVCSVDLEITETQAFTGCTVPFWDDGTVHDFVVEPGRYPKDCTESYTRNMEYPLDEMIGRSHVGTKTIRVKVTIQAPHVEPPPPPPPAPEKPKPEEKRDAEMSLPLCALGLFTGGRVTVFDPRDNPIQITIPPGHDPELPFIFTQKGYGLLGERGRLIVKIVPIFKAPNALNEHELQQLKRLEEMIHK